MGGTNSTDFPVLWKLPVFTEWSPEVRPALQKHLPHPALVSKAGIKSSDPWCANFRNLANLPERHRDWKHAGHS